LREEHKLQVFKREVLRIISGPKKGEVKSLSKGITQRDTS